MTLPNHLTSLRVVIARGVGDHRRAPLTWGGSLGVMGALMAAIWPSIEDSASQLIENYPSGLKEAFGIEQLDTVEKYVDAEMLSFIVPLVVAFFGMRCATRAIVGAEERGHLDTLLAQPLSRRVLAAGSFAATAILVAAVLAVAWALTLLGGTIAGTGISATTIGAGMANVWPLAIGFSGLALFVSGLAHRGATVTAVATGVLVAMYVLDLVGKLSDDVEGLRALSAFRYYGSAIQDGLDLTHVVGLTAAGTLLAAAGAVLFERRDVL
jgi:ABC-2 type transport system permease protein